MNNPNAPRDITQLCGSTRTAVTITELRPCCYQVDVNGKPVSVFSERHRAEVYVARWGWRGNSKPSVGPSPAVPLQKKSAANEAANFVNEVIQCISPTVAFEYRL